MATVDRRDYLVRFFTHGQIDTVYLEHRSTGMTWGFQLHLAAPNGTFAIVSPVVRPETSEPKNLSKKNIVHRWIGDTLRFGVRSENDPWITGLEINLAEDDPQPQPFKESQKPARKEPPAATDEDLLIPVEEPPAETAGNTSGGTDFKFE